MKLGHTIDDSRKKYPEITNELLDSLQKWARDRGLPKIPEEQLALFAHSCYFDVEATKRCMNVYYRMRSTNPDYFNNRDVRLDHLQHSLKVMNFVILPKPDRNGNWIIFHRLADSRPSQYVFNDNLKLFLMNIDACLYMNGCSAGYVFLFDAINGRFGHLAKLSMDGHRKFLEYLQEGMPIRLKAMHHLNTVWFMDKLVKLLRPFIKQELYEMLHFYTDNISDVYPHIPPECLPKEYGGELDCIANLHKANCVKLDQLRDYFREEEALFHNYSPDNVKAASQKTMSNATEDLKDHHDDDDN